MPGSAIGVTSGGEGGQINVGDVGTLMAQKAGNLIMGVGGRNAAVDQLLIGPGGVSMPQAVVGHRAGGIRIPDLISDGTDKLLEAAHGDVGGDIIGDKQLMASGGDGQHFLQLSADALIDGDASDLAALSLDGDGSGTEGIFRHRGVQAEAFVNAEPDIIGQSGHGGVVLMTGVPAFEEEQAKLPPAPGAVYTAEAAPLQLDGQVAVAGKRVLGVHLIMEEANGRQIGLDGGRRFTLGLQFGNIGVQVFGRDIGQLLQMILFGQKTAKALHGFVVPLFGAVTALPVVMGQLVQLGNEGVVNPLVVDLHGHRKNLQNQNLSFRWAQFDQWQIRLFPPLFQWFLSKK